MLCLCTTFDRKIKESKKQNLAFTGWFEPHMLSLPIVNSVLTAHDLMIYDKTTQKHKLNVNARKQQKSQEKGNEGENLHLESLEKHRLLFMLMDFGGRNERN